MPELKKLCDNPRISSGANIGREIYVFRNGKYWKFDNKDRQTKPFGNLIEGAKSAKKKWPNIKFPAAVGYCRENLVSFPCAKSQYNQWAPGIGQKPSLLSLGDMGDFPDEPEGNEKEGGAVAPVSENIFAKMNKNKVCYIMVKKEKTYWNSHCVSVNEDAMHYPKDIVAVIKTKDKNINFINRDGKYCKRDEKSSKPVIDF